MRASPDRPRQLDVADGDATGRDHVDESVIARFMQGEEDALAAILRRYWTPIVTYAARYVGSDDAAQDIAQEAFTRLWQQRHEWIAERPVHPFLYRVAHNLAQNERRHRRVRAQWERAQRSRPVATAPSAAQLYEANVLHDRIERAITALPERRRQVFVLSRFDGLSYREIAEVLGISIQTVANQMSAALVALHSALAPFSQSNSRDAERSTTS